MRRIFGPRKDEAVEELNGMYTSPKICRVIRSREMGSVGCVASLGRLEVYTGFWWGKLKK